MDGNLNFLETHTSMPRPNRSLFIMQMVTNSTVAMIVKDIYILTMIVVFKDTQLYAYIHMHERYDVLIDLLPFLYRY